MGIDSSNVKLSPVMDLALVGICSAEHRAPRDADYACQSSVQLLWAHSAALAVSGSVGW